MLLAGLAVSKSAIVKYRVCVCECVREYVIEMMVQNGSLRDMVTRGAGPCIYNEAWSRGD